MPLALNMDQSMPIETQKCPMPPARFSRRRDPVEKVMEAENDQRTVKELHTISIMNMYACNEGK